MQPFVKNPDHLSHTAVTNIGIGYDRHTVYCIQYDCKPKKSLMWVGEAKRKWGECALSPVHTKNMPNQRVECCKLHVAGVYGLESEQLSMSDGLCAVQGLGWCTTVRSCWSVATRRWLTVRQSVYRRSPESRAPPSPRRVRCPRTVSTRRANITGAISRMDHTWRPAPPTPRHRPRNHSSSHQLVFVSHQWSMSVTQRAMKRTMTPSIYQFLSARSPWRQN